jgi:hypothetical protein
MKKLVISALALGAMTSVAFAEPMPLSPVQMDGVTAGGKRINVDVAVIKIRQSNKANQWNGGNFADDLSGKCDDCNVFQDASNNLSQSNSATVSVSQ